MGQCRRAPAAGRLTKKAPAHAHEVTLAGDSSREREGERESVCVCLCVDPLAACAHR